MSEGLKNAGFDVKYANELSPMAAETYRYNHPETFVDVKDIRKVRAADIRKHTGRKVTLVAGGPPCQGFSTLGKRNPRDPRSRLVKEFVRIVMELKPRFFLMENVPGIMSISEGRLFAGVQKVLSEEYHVSHRILNAADFGVPQNRKRVFIFGSRESEKSIDEASFRKRKHVSLKDAIGDLNFLGNGESASEYALKPTTSYQRAMRKGNGVLTNHEATRHRTTALKRLSMIKPGKDISSIPKRSRIKKRIMYRLNPKEPSRTMTTLPDDYIHYSANRILTVREMARIQSFKDVYKFCNKRTTGGPARKRECPQYTQVGNVVPPRMAEGVGKWVLQ